MESAEQLRTHLWVAERMQVLEPPSAWEPNPEVAIGRYQRRLSDVGRSPRRVGWRHRWMWAVPAVCVAVVAIWITLPTAWSLAQRVWTRVHGQSQGGGPGYSGYSHFQVFSSAFGVGKYCIGELPRSQFVADARAATGLAAFVPHLPERGVLSGNPGLTVFSSQTQGITVDRAELNAALRRAGVRGRIAPPEWEGAAIIIRSSPIVAVTYPSQNLTLMQTPPPVVTTPPGLNFGTLVETVLQIAGTGEVDSRRMATSLATTLFLFPVELGDVVRPREVKLRLGRGTLLHDRNDDGGQWRSTLLWSTAERLYFLRGNSADERLIEIANSVE